MGTIIKYGNTQIADLDGGATAILPTKDKVMSDNLTINVAGGSSSIYKFYDANNVELTTHTVAGLATATQYTKGSDTTKKPLGGKIFFINGGAVEGTDDKFYVLYGTIGFSKKWSSNTSTSISNDVDGIGVGKINTTNGITAYSADSGSIWEWINGLRTSASASCNDWFIPSWSESSMLKDAIRTNPSIFEDYSQLFTYNSTWSSVENSDSASGRAMRWDYYESGWISDAKSTSRSVFAIRSF